MHASRATRLRLRGRVCNRSDYKSKHQKYQYKKIQWKSWISLRKVYLLYIHFLLFHRPFRSVRSGLLSQQFCTIQAEVGLILLLPQLTASANLLYYTLGTLSTYLRERRDIPVSVLSSGMQDGRCMKLTFCKAAANTI